MNISIRPAKKEDVDCAIPLMFSAGPEAFRYVLSVTSQDQVLTFLHKAFINGHGEFGYQSHWVACKGDEIVGLVGIRQAEDNIDYMKSAIANIFRFYSVFQSFGVIYRGLKVEHIIKPPLKGTVCLHNLGVAPKMQGSGIGKLLIGHVIAQAMQRNIATVSLDVAETNPKAKALYLRFGFEAKAFNYGNLIGKFGRAVSHEYMEYQVAA